MDFNMNSGFITPQEAYLLKKSVKQNDKDITELEQEVAEIAEDVEGVVSAVNELAESKQDKLTAGENITIDENNVISATGGGSSKKYQLVANITLEEDIPNADPGYTINLQGAYDNVYIQLIDNAIAANQPFRIRFISGTTVINQLAQNMSATNKGFECECFDRNGFYKMEAHPITPGNIFGNSSAFWGNSYNYSTSSTENKITSITIRPNQANTVIHTGTTIKVWAC